MKLEPCPFCGGEAVITRRGNDLTRTRAVEIKCPLCGVKRVTGAIRQPLAWCETTATKLWNARPASGGLEGAAVERVFATILDGTLDNVARASLGEALKALRALPDSGEVEDDRIENAMQAAAETHRSWELRCHAIMNALGLDYGDPEWELPETARKKDKEVEKLREAVARSAIHEDFDYPGDAPEFIGWECSLCLSGVEIDGKGHDLNCVAVGIAPTGKRAKSLAGTKP